MKCNRDNLEAFQFESPIHSDLLLVGLRKMQQRELLFDITFLVEGQEFKAHKVVLASCSEYFRAMFTVAMKESTLDTVQLNGVSAVGMKHLLDYAYSSKLTLDLANVQDVLGAASHFEMIPIVEACAAYLQTHIDLDNCIDVLNVAEMYSLDRLRQVAYCFLGQAWHKLINMADFYRISSPQLYSFLQRDFPVDAPEYEVLEGVLQWLFLADTNKKHTDTLLRTINYNSIKLDDLGDIQNRQEFRNLDIETGVFSQMEDLYHKSRLGLNGDSGNSVLVNTRGFVKTIINIGGYNSGDLTNSLTFYDPEEKEWKYLTKIPHGEQSGFGVAVIDNSLYVVGGCIEEGLEDHIHPYGFKYDSRSDKWKAISPMLHDRCLFSLVAAKSTQRGESELYAIAGLGEHDSFQISGPCECYSPETDKWRSIAPLPDSNARNAASVFENRIFVSGGMDYDTIDGSLWEYSITFGIWLMKTAMTTPRVDHVMASHDGKLYVAGGWNCPTPGGNRAVVSTVDSYCIETDQWQTITNLPTARYHLSMVLLDDKLHFIGGFEEGRNKTAIKKIETYNIKQDDWNEQGSIALESWEHISCSMFIPLARHYAKSLAIHC